MSQATAAKIVLGFVLGGVALGLWTGNGAAGKYRKVWGATLLGLVGAALADLAPAIVGPYFLLVIIAYSATHTGQLAGISRQLQSGGSAPAPRARKSFGPKTGGGGAKK